MAPNGSKVEVTMVEVAAEVMVVLMALHQIARIFTQIDPYNIRVKFNDLTNKDFIRFFLDF